MTAKVTIRKVPATSGYPLSWESRVDRMNGQNFEGAVNWAQGFKSEAKAVTWGNLTADAAGLEVTETAFIDLTN